MARTVSFNVSESENSRIEALMSILKIPKMSELVMESVRILSDMEEFARQGYTFPVMINPADRSILPLKVQNLDKVGRQDDDMIIPFRKP